MAGGSNSGDALCGSVSCGLCPQMGWIYICVESCLHMDGV
jgi:hypothetical protein